MRAERIGPHRKLALGLVAVALSIPGNQLDSPDQLKINKSISYVEPIIPLNPQRIIAISGNLYLAEGKELS